MRNRKMMARSTSTSKHVRKNVMNEDVLLRLLPVFTLTFPLSYFPGKA